MEENALKMKIENQWEELLDMNETENRHGKGCPGITRTRRVRQEQVYQRLNCKRH